MLRHFQHLSVAITCIGLMLVVLAAAIDLNPVVTLVGLMLTLTGVVEFIAIRLWVEVAALGTDRHRPIPPL